MTILSTREELTRAAILAMKLKVKGSLEGNRVNIPVHCPFHEDKTPSLFIHIRDGVYKCFSCQRQGSIESLFHDVTGESLYKAFNIKYNEFNEFALRQQGDSKPQNLDELDKTIIITIEGTISPILASHEAIRYLRNRGISLDVANAMNFRYADKVYINKTLFENRLLIPIYEKGRMISVEGRDVSRKSPVKVLYPKNSSVNTLFELDKLDKQKPLYVVEGLMDLALLRAYKEFENSTAIFGASLTQRQIYLLQKFDEVIYIPDNDRAGESTIKAFKENKMNNVRILRIPSVINNVSIIDVGDLVIKAQTSIADLLRKKWLLRSMPILI